MERNLPVVPTLGGEQSLNRYLSEIKKFPVLAPEQEYMLAKRFSEHGDRDAAAQLVTSHLRLVAKIAMGYRGYGLPVSELISEGNIGLMQGVKKFEPERGFRLATYAMCGSRPRCRSSSCARGAWSRWARPPRRRSCSSTCVA
jgi:RNA polymerase sigma-32 factor